MPKSSPTTGNACARKKCKHKRDSHKVDSFGRIFCDSVLFDPMNNIGKPCQCTGFVEKPKP